MAFVDLEESVAEEFSALAAQDGHLFRKDGVWKPASVLQLAETHTKGNHAYRVFDPSPHRDESHRKPYKRRRTEAAERADIRAALERGERPAWRPGQRGRPPKRWIEEATKLGIDLRAELAQGEGS